MAKKSFDMKKVKQFLFEKGERVGLAFIGALAVLMVVLGFLGPATRPPASAGNSWPQAISKAAQEMRTQMNNAQPGDDLKKMVIVTPPIPKNTKPDKDSYNYYEVTSEEEKARRNPRVLPVNSDPQDIQIEYQLAPTLAYDVHLDRRKFGVLKGDKDGGDKSPIKVLEPRRLVIVSASFPYRKQLEEFQKALQYKSLDELMAGKDMPRILGLNVLRYEVRFDGKEYKEVGAPLPLYASPKLLREEFKIQVPDDDKIKVADNLDQLFKRMVIDTKNPARYQDYLGPNMVTPLPYLASISGEPGKYMDLKLAENVPAPEEEVKQKKGMDQPQKNINFFQQPMKPNPQKEKDDGIQEGELPLKDLPPDLWERLNGNYNVFDPYGTPLEQAAENNKKKAKRTKGFQGFPGGKPQIMPPGFNQPDIPNFNQPNFNQPNMRNKAKEPDQDIERLLVRFIDTDVEVGKTYRYYIQVRMANPNFGGDKEVAAQDMAKIKELPPSDWTLTPVVSIPPEHYFYVVDQALLPHEKDQPAMVTSPEIQKVGNDHFIDAFKVAELPKHGEMTAVQVHRWVDQAEGLFLGNWVIAERLLVRRGEPIGRNEVMVEALVWNSHRGRFELAQSSSRKSHVLKAIKVNFLVDNPPPLMVDFRGGKGSIYQTPSAPKSTFTDEAAVEMLVLTPDGKLVVRNAREESDPATPIGRQRLETYERWREQLLEVRNQKTAPGPGGNQPVRFPGLRR